MGDEARSERGQIKQIAMQMVDGQVHVATQRQQMQTSRDPGGYQFHRGWSSSRGESNRQ